MSQSFHASNNTDRNNDLFEGYVLSFNKDEGKYWIEPIVEKDKVAATIREYAKSPAKQAQWLTHKVRPHGAYRQVMMALYQLSSDDTDQIKAGVDRLKKYQEILANDGCAVIDWEAEGVNVMLLATSKWSPEKNKLVYSGLAVFLENTPRGHELLQKLVSNPPPRKKDHRPAPAQLID